MSQEEKDKKLKKHKDKTSGPKKSRDPFSMLEKFATPIPELKDGEIDTPKDIEGFELLDESVVKEEYTKAAELEKPKSKKKSIIISVIFLAINIAFVSFLATSLLKSADSSIIGLFKTQGKRMWWLLLSVALLGLSFVADAAAFALLIKKITGKSKPWLAYKTTSMGKYYEAITPLAIGMQPGQIVELSKGGISPGVATSIPIMKMLVYNIMNVVLSIVFLAGVGSQITSVVTLAEGARILLIVFEVLAYIGIVLSLGTILVTILIANSKMVGRSLARFVVRAGFRLRIVKNYRTAYSKLMRSVLEFQNSMNYFKKHKWVLFGCIGLITISLLALASIPFSVVMALSDMSFSSVKSGFWIWAESVARYYICFNASYHIPLPGGTGMMEIAFIAMFGNSRFLPSQTQFVYGFLFWRMISYYLIIVNGVVMIIYSTSKTISSAKKANRKKATKVDAEIQNT